MMCPLLPSLSPFVRAGSARLPPAAPAARAAVPRPGPGVPVWGWQPGLTGLGSPRVHPDNAGQSRGAAGARGCPAWKGLLAQPGHAGEGSPEVPVLTSLPRCWQGTWPGCWQRDPLAPTLTAASRTASSSWGTAWPRTRRRRAWSCRGCAESAGEYGAWPAWLLALSLSEVSCPPGSRRACAHACAPHLTPVSD